MKWAGHTAIHWNALIRLLASFRSWHRPDLRGYQPDRQQSHCRAAVQLHVLASSKKL